MCEYVKNKTIHFLQINLYITIKHTYTVKRRSSVLMTGRSLRLTALLHVYNMKETVQSDLFFCNVLLYTQWNASVPVTLLSVYYMSVEYFGRVVEMSVSYPISTVNGPDFA